MGFFSNFSNRSRAEYVKVLFFERAKPLVTECYRRGLGKELTETCRAVLRQATAACKTQGIKKQISTAESMSARADWNRDKNIVESAAIFPVALFIECAARAKSNPDWHLDFWPIADAAEQLLMEVVHYESSDRDVFSELFDMVAPEHIVSAKYAGSISNE